MAKLSNFFKRLQTLFEDDISMNGNENVMYCIKFSSLEHPLVPKEDYKRYTNTYNLMNTVLNYCQRPKLNLIKSPPNILEIIPNLHVHLNSIIKNNPHVYSSNGYFRIFIRNLDSKCIKVIRLFKDNKDLICDKTSLARLKLTKHILTFSHMYYELIALSPEGNFNFNYKMTKLDAEEFWKGNFNDKIIVSWEEFQPILKNVHHFEENCEESNCLKKTMDLTSSNYISKFEFDVFTRLFQPWSNLLDNWRVLALKHPAYGSFLTYDQVRLILQNYLSKPGSYVFRLSCTQLGNWAIGYVAPNKNIYQTIPSNKSLIQALVDGNRDGYYCYPNGQCNNPDLEKEFNLMTQGKTVHVSEEEFEMYCSIGSTFEICKICDENDKDIRIEPCGHLICKNCLYSWQRNAVGGKNCPFCRCEIRGTEDIQIEKFQNTSGKNMK
uniref:E3 ubiquitin-protein ligase CBL n=1 Tax=Strongyloides papillosus TaxID=174720 RepID=A0A0N5BL95_STREA